MQDHCIILQDIDAIKISRLESWPDHQGHAGGLYDLFRDCLQLVELQDALDFGAEAVQQALAKCLRDSAQLVCCCCSAAARRGVKNA